MPLSIVGTFAVMYLLGYSLNNLSLMALTLSVGFVVDDAIVMLENIVRYMEMGKPRMEAALLASREIGFTIVSMTISLVAVFIPVLFMGGIVGRLLHEFSVTIAVAILISGFVSLTLHADAGQPLPALRPRRRGTAACTACSKRGFDGMTRAYDYTLRKVLQHRFATVVFAFAMLGGTVYLFLTMPTGFIPSQDSGFIFGVTHGRAGHFLRLHGASISAPSRTSSQHDPNVQSVGAFLPRRQSGIRFRQAEAARGARAFRGSGHCRSCGRNCAAVPGIMAFLQNPPPITISGSRSPKRLSDDAAEHQPEGDLRLGAASWWTGCARCRDFWT